MKQIFTAATVDEAKNKAAVEFGTDTCYKRHDCP